jgi:hypothetical protein
MFLFFAVLESLSGSFSLTSRKSLNLILSFLIVCMEISQFSSEFHGSHEDQHWDVKYCG